MKPTFRDLNPFNYTLTKEYIVLEQCARLAEDKRLLILENILLNEELRVLREKCKKEK